HWRSISDHSCKVATLPDFSRFSRTLSLPGQKFGNIAGLAFIVLGTVMVGIAAARFVMTAKNIDREDLRPGTGSRIDIAFAGLLVLLGCALFLLMHALVTKL